MPAAKADTTRVVAIGTSLGGLAALRAVLGGLPPDLDASVLVVMHIGHHRSLLTDLLAAHTRLMVRSGTDQQPLAAGKVFVAPPDRHMLVVDRRIRLSEGPKENYTRPAIDPLFRSVALEFGPAATGVVLTGELDDGAAGAAAIAACGGTVIVQDPDDCVAPSMPSSALRAVQAARVLPLASIADAIVEAVASPVGHMVTTPDTALLATELRFAKGQQISAPEDMDRIGERSTLTCPECGGVVWKIRNHHPVRYRCHVGHAFTQGTLQSVRYEMLETTLWAAIRMAGEFDQILKEEAEAAGECGDPGRAESVQLRREKLRSLEALIRRAIEE